MPHYENVPFEVPNSWEWCKIEDFAYDLQYGTSDKSLHTGIVPVLRMGNISRDGTVDYTDLVYSSNEEDIAKFSLQLNDLLFNRTNSSEWVGKTAIYKAEKDAIFAGYLIRIRTFIVCPDYINYVMNSSYHRHWCNQVKTDAVNQSNINAQKLSNLLVPVPPTNEQKRIVSEIEQWMALIDEIETDKQSMQEFIKLAKSKILGFAIHGKLVHHDPNDEPAVELLKRINPNATICDTSHYGNLPTNWSISTMSDLCRIIDGEKQSNINRIYLDVKYLRGKSDGEYLMSGKFVPANSTMILVDGENSGEIFTTTIDGYQGSTFKILDISKEMYKPFVLYIIMSYQKQLRENKVGSAIPHLNKKLFREIVVGVPPYEEQKRIVAGIDKLFSYLNTISADL